MVKHYKSRLRKMLAAQRDFHGGFRINVDAQVAEGQLMKRSWRTWISELASRAAR